MMESIVVYFTPLASSQNLNAVAFGSDDGGRQTRGNHRLRHRIDEAIRAADKNMFGWRWKPFHGLHHQWSIDPSAVVAGTFRRLSRYGKDEFETVLPESSSR